MKKNIKKAFLLITIFLLSLITTGCVQDNMDNIDILVTNYSNEYVTKALYEEHAIITSIYPDGVNIDNYKISNKQKKEFANTDLFIYNGLIEKERNLALELLELNSNLKIIDSAYVLETDYSPEELWLNPASLLMMTQNIHIGLEEYITNKYLQDDVDKSYEELKIKLSELDANYRLTIENVDNKIIVVDNSALNFLQKFGLNVMCIDANATDKVISDIENLIKENKISYIFSFKDEALSENAKKIIEENENIKNLSLHKLDSITDKERSEEKDYITIMEENLELLKQELYQ